jgi:hypothetical protein
MIQFQKALSPGVNRKNDPMKTKSLKAHIQVNSNTLLTPSFSDPDDFSALIEDFVSSLVIYKPSHWGFDEPFNNVFDMSQVRSELRKGYNDFSWKRKSPPKGWGVFKKRTYPLKGTKHASNYLDVSANSETQVSSHLEYLKHTAMKFGADYIFCDSLSMGYRDYAMVNGLAPSGRLLMVFTHTLVRCLPDIVWWQCFGPAYVRLFGLGKLLSTPAYKVEQIGPEMVCLQLSESLFDVHNQYSEVHAVRQRVKEHLDDNIFFSVDNSAGHVYRTPQFEFP